VSFDDCLFFWLLTGITHAVKVSTRSALFPAAGNYTFFSLHYTGLFLIAQVCTDIATQEKMIADLKRAIKAKEDPMKVAQTRLHHREFRPKVELCRDPPQYGWVTLSLFFF
jgi:hypothetical protein